MGIIFSFLWTVPYVVFYRYPNDKTNRIFVYRFSSNCYSRVFFFLLSLSLSLSLSYFCFSDALLRFGLGSFYTKKNIFKIFNPSFSVDTIIIFWFLFMILFDLY